MGGKGSGRKLATPRPVAPPQVLGQGPLAQLRYKIKAAIIVATIYYSPVQATGNQTKVSIENLEVVKFALYAGSRKLRIVVPRRGNDGYGIVLTLKSGLFRDGTDLWHCEALPCDDDKYILTGKVHTILATIANELRRFDLYAASDKLLHYVKLLDLLAADVQRPIVQTVQPVAADCSEP